mmetsp:Transcript_15668/g.25751  ORF Transcript_15668/g.25751 Transcript_15668/m.25751 type:complete len:295 (-) Transcript_15668:83-967(-)
MMSRLPSLRLHSSLAAQLRSCPSNQHRSFSTQPAAAQKKESKSPHSKLLRICSSRNVNPHFAAIEGEMLRLNWDESMKNLVADWARNKRFDEFVELERNVKSYVEKNLPFITLDRCNYHTKNSILLEHYPYESIISSCAELLNHEARSFISCCSTLHCSGGWIVRRRPSRSRARAQKQKQKRGGVIFVVSNSKGPMEAEASDNFSPLPCNANLTVDNCNGTILLSLMAATLEAAEAYMSASNTTSYPQNWRQPPPVDHVLLPTCKVAQPSPLPLELTHTSVSPGDSMCLKRDER